MRPPKMNQRPPARTPVSILRIVLVVAATTALAAEGAQDIEEKTTSVYWGDTHVHTSYSGDGYATGTRLDPPAAYRFARGEAVQATGGATAQLDRPLDFIVIADHGNNMGAAMARGRYQEEPEFRDSPLGQLWLTAETILKKGQFDPAEVDDGKLLPTHRSWNISVRHPQFRKSIWERVTANADQFNEPGRFTAFAGYEWTPGLEEGNADHRVVLFADDQSRTKTVLPFTSYDSSQEEDLWAFLDRYESATGGRVIAIPHNSNLTMGGMFALQDSYGVPLTEEYANTRARFEPLVEVTQIKGDSETHPYLSPDDSFADYETWDGWLGWAKSKEVTQARAEQLPYEYVRSALKLGLALKTNIGKNPFQFGMIGSTDAHTGLAAADDDNFWGKSATAQPSATRIFNKIAAYNWQMNAAGYAGVWATENTREAIFDAMLRKETYATTGPRMTVRFFGGFNFNAQDAASNNIAALGYSKGVPMGSNLPRTPGSHAPTFLISALKDPHGANLDRVQVVKGWRTSTGELKESVYDVAWSGDRRIRDNKLIDEVGSTVNLETAIYTNTIGSVQLSTAWEDTEFNPDEQAFYYVRVLQIPTPRWSSYDIVRYQLSEFPAELPRETQERAYTSPIWYSPI